MLVLSLNKTSFQKEEFIIIDIESIDALSKEDLVKSLNIWISKVNPERNDIVFGTGVLIFNENGKKNVKVELKKYLTEGIYAIESINWQIEKQSSSLLRNRDFQSPFFYLGDRRCSDIEINETVTQILKERKQYRQFKYLTNRAKSSSIRKEYRCIIFCKNALIHNIQELKGITIFPIKNDLSASGLRSVINNFLTKRYNGHLDETENTFNKFKSAEQLFCIEINLVQAIDQNDAMNFCNKEVENIFSILGYKLGQRPSMLAAMLIDLNENHDSYLIVQPNYHGNLAPDFTPTKLTQQIDKIQSVMSENPLAKFLIDSYSSVQNEYNHDIKCIRLWSILELLSANLPNGLPLADNLSNSLKLDNGDDLTTDHVTGKVYKYILESKIDQHTFSVNGKSIIFQTNLEITSGPSAVVITLWEFVKAVYLIRNKVVHIGKFDRVKYKGRKSKYIIPVNYYYFCIDFLDSITKKLIETQLK